MIPEEYLRSLKDRLAEEAFIIDNDIIREQFSAINAQLRIRLTFLDHSKLEFSEYIRLNDEGQISVAAYSYHWMDAENQLRMRWDNADHYPTLPGFPHHLHDGDEKNVLPGEPMNLFKVLDIIAARLEQLP